VTIVDVCGTFFSLWIVSLSIHLRKRIYPLAVEDHSAERKSSTPHGGSDRTQSFASLSIVRKTSEPFRLVALAMTVMPAMTKR
jgi:hypothetical protein